MTKLQRRVLEVLDNRGTMSLSELEQILEVRRLARGGFRGTIQLLEKAGLIDGCWVGPIRLTGAGVRAVEAANLAEEARG